MPRWANQCCLFFLSESKYDLAMYICTATAFICTNKLLKKNCCCQGRRGCGPLCRRRPLAGWWWRELSSPAGTWCHPGGTEPQQPQTRRQGWLSRSQAAWRNGEVALGAQRRPAGKLRRSRAHSCKQCGIIWKNPGREVFGVTRC